MTELLRDVLAAGEAETPAGADLSAVRRHARALRRRRLAVVASVTAVVAAVAVPIVLASGPARTVTAGPPTDRLGCPPRPAAGSAADTAVPFAADHLLMCRYRTGDDTLAGAQLVSDPVLVAAAEDQLTHPASLQARCPPGWSWREVATFAGDGKGTATIDPDPDWCGVLSPTGGTDFRSLNGVRCPDAVEPAALSRHPTESPGDTLLLCRLRVHGDDHPLVTATAVFGTQALHLGERVLAVAAVPALDDPPPVTPPDLGAASRCPDLAGSVVFVMRSGDPEPWAALVPNPCGPAGTLSAQLLALTS